MHASSGLYNSWRGKRDPSFASALDNERKRASIINGGLMDHEKSRRSEFAGFGGMKRRR